MKTLVSSSLAAALMLSTAATAQTYGSGYALRIPRFKRERVDKSVREADTMERLVRLYNSYKG